MIVNPGTSSKVKMHMYVKFEVHIAARRPPDWQIIRQSQCHPLIEVELSALSIYNLIYNSYLSFKDNKRRVTIPWK